MWKKSVTYVQWSALFKAYSSSSQPPKCFNEHGDPWNLKVRMDFEELSTLFSGIQENSSYLNNPNSGGKSYFSIPAKKWTLTLSFFNTSHFPHLESGQQLGLDQTYVK